MVAVLPIPKSGTFSLVSTNDVTVTTMRGSGPGGQHRNKTDSCVRMVHKETGLSATIDGRDQQANRREARRILSAKIFDLNNQKTQSSHDADRKSQLGSGGRGDKVRTYNFIKSRAVDHRTGKKTSKVRDVIEKGKLNLIR